MYRLDCKPEELAHFILDQLFRSKMFPMTKLTGEDWKMVADSAVKANIQTVIERHTRD